MVCVCIIIITYFNYNHHHHHRRAHLKSVSEALRDGASVLRWAEQMALREVVGLLR